MKRIFAAASADVVAEGDDDVDSGDDTKGPWKILASVRKMCLFGGWMGRKRIGVVDMDCINDGRMHSGGRVDKRPRRPVGSLF